MTDAVKSMVWSIVSVFETGKRPGPESYGTIAVLRDGAGFSIGAHQATDKSDAADEVLMEYISLGGQFAAEFESFLPRFTADESLSLRAGDLPYWAQEFVRLFKRAAHDPIMARAQDAVFTRSYWDPAVSLCRSIGVIEPLQVLAVYDMAIQSGMGGVARNRSRFAELPPSRGGDGRRWAEAFTRARLAWLVGYRSSDPDKDRAVRASAYRADAILRLMELGAWDLRPPVTIMGVTL